MCNAVSLILLAIVCADQPEAQKIGLAHNQNFIVTAPSQDLAQEVLKKADSLRKQIALDWLGEELPPNVGQTSIQVKLSESEDEAHTWLIDNPKRRLHLMWLTTSKEKALGATLAHEIVHVVLATQFPGGLPTWAHEGAACFQDDQERVKRRTRTIEWMAKTKNWPDLKKLLDASSIPAEDHAAFCVASSLTEYLLEHGDKAKFLEFAFASKTDGCGKALERVYSIRSVADLQTRWQDWVSERSARKSNSPPAKIQQTKPAPKSSPGSDPKLGGNSAAVGSGN